MFDDKSCDSVSVRSSEICLKDTGLRKHSQFMPYLNSPVIDMFITTVRNGINQIRHSENRQYTRNIWLGAIKILLDDVSITIKPADKGGAFVVMDTSQYLEEMCRQLDNVKVYEEITSDPKFRLGSLIGTLVMEAYNANIIDKDLKEFLIVDYPVMPVIYCIPKIQKSRFNPPGRPIVSGQGSIFSPIAMSLD